MSKTPRTDAEEFDRLYEPEQGKPKMVVRANLSRELETALRALYEEVQAEGVSIKSSVMVLVEKALADDCWKNRT